MTKAGSVRDHRQTFSRARSALASGEDDLALGILGDLVRTDDLSVLLRQRAGQAIAGALYKTGTACIELSLLGRVTTTWLAPMVVAAAWADGHGVRVSEGEYDNVVQDLSRLRSAAKGPDVVALVPWTQSLLSADDRSSETRIEDELEMWRLAWRMAGEAASRVVQVGYDWTTPGSAGYLLSGHGDADVSRLRRLNRALRDSLAAALPSASCFVDLSLVSGQLGRDRFYDPRRQAWTRQPMSDLGAELLARYVWVAARALMIGPRKVLVLDLDNTLWGGIVGERGGPGVELGDSPEGEAYRSFQQHCRRLAERGVVLAVASKNNPADARAPFLEHPDSILRLDDFAAFEAGWQPKVEMLRSIATRLDLGLDHMVFFDDNPAEREHIHQSLPQVQVIDVPPDPADYIRALSSSLAFETPVITDEDLARSGDYRDQARRRELRDAEPVSLEDYLRSLDMRGKIRSIDETDMPRVLQLLAKTNQWNLTTRRHSDAQVRSLLAQRRSIGLTLRLEDRFGSSGLVAVLLATAEDDDTASLRIDSWLMSCRIIGRTAEHFLFTELVMRARDHGYARLIGEYRPTAKNLQVADHYLELGFLPLEVAQVDSANQRFVLTLTETELPWSAVRPAGEVVENDGSD